MPRFFKQNFEQEPFIEGDDARHISRSLRMKTGESLVVCDSKGNDYFCTINEIIGDTVTLNIDEKRPSQSEPDVLVTVCPCLLKGDKLDSVIKHSVELGAYEFTPILSANCVSRPDNKSLKNKLVRWNKIALEAAGQCGRGIIPKVNTPLTLKYFCKDLLQSFDLVLFFYEAGGEPLGQTMWDNDSAQKIAVITGPEGGFTKEEAELLNQSGAKTITLGKRILRAETAPLAALTGLMLLTDNLE